MSLLYPGSKISHPFSQMSYLTTTSFIMPLSGYRTLTSPLHSNISSSILSLTLYQLVGNFTYNYLTQLNLDNSYPIIGIHFTYIRNLKKRSYPLTNPPAFTLLLIFPWILFNVLISTSLTILTDMDCSFMNFHSIPRDVRITTLAHLASLSF